MGKLIADQLKTGHVLDVLIISKKQEDCDFYRGKFGVDASCGSFEELLTNYVQLRERKVRDKVHNSRGIIIVDDVDIMKSNTMARLCLAARHYNITLLIVVPYTYYMTPELRNNMDYIFMLPSDMFVNHNKIYEQYCGMFPKFDHFREVFMHSKVDYCGMVTVNKSGRNLLTDKVFYLK